MREVFLGLALWGGLGAGAGAAEDAAESVVSSSKVPALRREFRGVWVATVNNMNWPSRPGLSSEQQRAELIQALDLASQLRLNAVMFQVRPACDAFYASTLEPWSEYLTGTMGQAPQPYYDPLAVAVEEAHQRGLELHAWFNPFRARHSSGRGAPAASHVSRSHPEWVRKYGAMQWLDPGETKAQEHSLRVILDVVSRYDIDGVHLDDYFYPYPEKSGGQVLDFPDESSWQRYLAGKGKLARPDWRRSNVDRFIERLYRSVKARKPAVKVGISPFGIWRPGFPAQIRGFDAYESLYADSRRWLREGWLDYLVPQLYWSIEAKEQSFPVLLRWWADQNVKHRHLCPGISANRVGSGWAAQEILQQVAVGRREKGVAGHVLWSVKALRDNRSGITGALQTQAYAEPALVPAFSWLDNTKPQSPGVQVRASSAGRVQWQPGGPDPVWLWVVQSRTEGKWEWKIFPGQTRSCDLRGRPDVVAVSAVDRAGNASAPTVLRKNSP